MRTLLALALVACSGPRDPNVTTPTGSGSTVVTTPVDAPEANQEAKLAAIQKAMNELDEAAQTCWAIAATDRFDIEGEVEVLVEIEPTTAKTQVARDTTRNSKLLGCLAELLAKYKWAPPLYGQAIKLPFKFSMPANGQNTIDRNLVTWNGQGKISVAVLLDENNTANGMASMVEVALQSGAATGMRIADRAELWYFLGAANIVSGKKTFSVISGDMMLVPPGTVRDVRATSGDVHAMIAFVPGGREGTARAGALPTREAGDEKSAPPIILPANKAKTYGNVTIFAEPATTKSPQLAASVLQLAANGSVPMHEHAKETELLYILSGSGTMIVDGVTLPITPTTVVQIPLGAKHSFRATADTRAVQIYTPAGPEQRFKAKP